MSNIPKEWKVIRGNTFSVKEELHAMGARYDGETKLWYIRPDRLREAEALVEDRAGTRQFKKW